MNLLISIIKLLGGLALLIYGMKILSTNLKKISGGKLEKFLASATNNNFKGILTGLVITVATQSSSATTIIVVGLVNSEILKLRNAVPIIMGANIGTTITTQILRLSTLNANTWISFFTPAVLTPILILIGLLILETAKKKKRADIGQMIIGIGLVFTGMITMVDMASSFSDLPILSKMITKLSNPILGIIVGAVITAIVQSSSATVGILQAISTTGIVPYATAIPIILGQNIGTCVTSMLASIGGSKNAKRTAGVHLYFNIIGTAIFFIFIYTYQTFIGFSFWQNNIDMGQIANFHTLFNVVSTIILFPFINLIEKLTIFTIRDKKEKEDDESDYLSILNMLDERVANIPNIAITNSIAVIGKMGQLSEKNFQKSMELIEKFQTKQLEKIKAREDSINKIEENVTEFLVKLSSLDLSDSETIKINTLLKIESDFEKIGDYSYEFSKIVEEMNEKDIKLSEKAYKEIQEIYNTTQKTISDTNKIFENNDSKLIEKIETSKEIAKLQKEKCKNAHIERLKKKECNIESGIAFLELLTICDKIIDHCNNIKESVI